MKQFHTSVGNMLIYLNVQIIFDDIRNKLFPAGETLQFLLSLKHIFKIWPPKERGHDFMGKLHGDAPNED